MGRRWTLTHLVILWTRNQVHRESALFVSNTPRPIVRRGPKPPPRYRDNLSLDFQEEGCSKEPHPNLCGGPYLGFNVPRRSLQQDSTSVPASNPSSGPDSGRRECRSRRRGASSASKARGEQKNQGNPGKLHRTHIHQGFTQENCCQGTSRYFTCLIFCAVLWF